MGVNSGSLFEAPVTTGWHASQLPAHGHTQRVRMRGVLTVEIDRANLVLTTLDWKSVWGVGLEAAILKASHFFKQGSLRRWRSRRLYRMERILRRKLQDHLPHGWNSWRWKTVWWNA